MVDRDHQGFARGDDLGGQAVQNPSLRASDVSPN
jgi:hypothetical protein